VYIFRIYRRNLFFFKSKNLNLPVAAEIFTLTEKAKIKMAELMIEENISTETHFLRVGVKGGGCSGLSYELGFDNKEQEGDNLVEIDGFRVAVDKKSFLYLFGTELDFTSGLNGKGFQFINPNASRTCGCGESFSI
jgi:iron-sulfur cluster assembly protein